MHTKDLSICYQTCLILTNPIEVFLGKTLVIAFMKKTRAPAECFLHAQSVLSQCNTGLRLLHLLYDMKVMVRKNKARFFKVLCSVIK